MVNGLLCRTRRHDLETPGSVGQLGPTGRTRRQLPAGPNPPAPFPAREGGDAPGAFSPLPVSGRGRGRVESSSLWRLRQLTALTPFGRLVRHEGVGRGGAVGE